MVLHVGFVAPSAPAVRRRAAMLGFGHVVFESLAVEARDLMVKTWWNRFDVFFLEKSVTLDLVYFLVEPKVSNI